MESKPRKTPLIAIVGPTASGKSKLAIELAKKFNGEIICADSRTIYKNMDIGTAKPSSLERQEVKHHLLDAVNPDEHFSASQFKDLATKAINNIASRSKVPFLVGGSGLYVDSVIFDFKFRPKHEMEPRENLNKLSIETLQALAKVKNLPLPKNDKNKRHLVRLIESESEAPTNNKIRANCLIMGLNVPRDLLKARIKKRAEKMVQDGLIDEVRELSSRYGWEHESMKGVGYREWRCYFEATQTKAETIEKIAQDTRQLAKRQMTWFKRNEHINWVKDLQEADELVEDFVSKFDTISS